jgi:cytosine/adenosine deaminase-related metal-dependent hydrolase
MLAYGVKVSLGTDGAPCSNTYDMFREMHLAAVIHKGNKNDAELICATDVLEMATINGAIALGLDHDVGSLEVGKKADFVILNTDGLYAAPFDASQILDGGMDPCTTVVHSCTGADVEMVVVDGNVLVRDRVLVSMDEDEIKSASKRAVRGIRERSGIKANVTRGWKYI